MPWSITELNGTKGIPKNVEYLINNFAFLIVTSRSLIENAEVLDLFQKLFYLLTDFFYILLLLTTIGLSPGGSSPTLIQTKIKIHKTTLTTKKLQN